jgi:Arc/MetJ-type ribon-helix-helix transcriptional regulator
MVYWKMSFMRLITLHIPEVYLRDLEELVTEKYYPNRAEAIRIAIKDLLDDELWSKRRTQNGT